MHDSQLAEAIGLSDSRPYENVVLRGRKLAYLILCLYLFRSDPGRIHSLEYASTR